MKMRILINRERVTINALINILCHLVDEGTNPKISEVLTNKLHFLTPHNFTVYKEELAEKAKEFYSKDPSLFEDSLIQNRCFPAPCDIGNTWGSFNAEEQADYLVLAFLTETEVLFEY